ncbi:MAG: prepilin-type N-terminal cleavage/methylation domain-containing protein [Eubacterium sp.]|nr:prepilin-type N-terminal cleavage/methylation domain-containing protein [Eubacterium sp.]
MNNIQKSKLNILKIFPKSDYERDNPPGVKKISQANKGFTLVELIVVLVLMTMILGIGFFGILGWQDWSRFKHEESSAEEIFFAAQNQLVELEGSGALDRKIINSLIEASNSSSSIDADTGYATNYILSESLLNNIVYETNGSTTTTYSWDDIWKLNENPDKERGTLLRLRAKTGDYDKYLDGSLLDGIDLNSGTTLTDEQLQKIGAKVLFDLIASYISDTSVLNHAIVLEFSPDACQVFSASYTDRADELLYESESPDQGNSYVSIMDRSIEVRSDNMVGYYSVDQLAQKIRGRGEKNANVKLELKNSNVLDLILYDTATDSNEVLVDGDTVVYTIFSDDGTGLMKLTMDIGDMYALETAGVKDITSAANNPTEVVVEYLSSEYSEMNEEVEVTTSGGTTKTLNGVKYRFPMYKNGNEYHMIFDAADVQAETLSYYETLEAMNDSIDSNDEELYFRNTYSFYRFGIDERKIFAQAEILKEGVSAGMATSGRNMGSYIETEDENGDQLCESPTFKDYSVDETDSSASIFEISNCRHLFNVRYETDYKNSYTASDSDSKNTYELLNDLDWEDFIGTNSSDGINYFLNSYDDNISADRLVSGIDYDGLSVATGNYESISESDGGTSSLYTLATSDLTDTVRYPFPGFRCLSKNDTFTSASNADNNSVNTTGDTENVYTISNLHITITGNILYGIYGREIKDACVNNDTDDYSEVLGLSNPDSIDSSGSKAARAGLMPLGLFAENLGDIKSVALNKHVVEGLQRVYISSGSGSTYRDYTVVYSCMVGGFAGNNIGSISNLTLFDNEDNNATSAKADITHINGRTDVGGIIGRQSFTTYSSKNYEAVLSDLYNYGHVTGMENVGGIVGRAYVHYVGDDSIYGENQYTGNNTGDIADEKGKYRYEYYHDGYRISDKTINGVVIDPDESDYANAKSYSMTGQVVYRDAKITISDCHNYGIISGDELVYNYVIDDDKHLYFDSKSDMSVVTYTQTRKMDPDDKTYRNNISYKNRCSFIGGIAGVFQDGLMVDDKNSVYTRTNSEKFMYDLYDALGFFSGNFQLASMKDCTSVMLYQDSEIDALVDTIDKKLQSSSENGVFRHDYYKGGLVGYARLFSVENCSNTYDDTESVFGYSNPETAVLGFRYVGGLFGCSDCIRYDLPESSTSTEDKTYTVTNEAIVLGRLYVGGISGGMGPGDEWQETFSFRDPSLNEGSMVSQIHCYQAYNTSVKGPIYNSNMLNAGSVLAIDSDNKFIYVYIKNENDNLAYTGGAGGIVGATSINILNCDNIQSEETKRRTLELIGFSETDIENILSDPDYLTSDMVQELMDASDAKFGGASVGGLVGIIRKDHPCDINSMANNTMEEAPGSEIDAVIFGRDFVGGAVGSTKTAYINNVKPVKADDSSCGMIIMGQDIVGGLLGYVIDAKDKDNIGLNQQSDALDWDNYTINDAYTVVGRYDVGGIIGLDYGQKHYVKIAVNPENPVLVKAKFYAGAYTGASRAKTMRCSGEISGVKVVADYFAGAYAGVYQYDNAIDSLLTYMVGQSSEKSLITSDIQIKAGMFAGGMFGLINCGHSNQFDNVNGSLYKVASALDANESVNAAYTTFTEANINGTATSNAKLETYSDVTFTMDFADSTTDDKNYELSGIYVEAGLFAGGLFGYVPEGLNISVSNFTNNCSVNATGYVGGDSGTAVAESYDSNIKHAYLGGVTGRVPTTMTLANCKNKATGTEAANQAIADAGGEAASIYEAANATYMGGLTEVNAGTIKDCINYTPYAYDTESIAAIAGINGVIDTDTDGSTIYPGTISGCTNEGTITGTNVAGIAVYSCGEISSSVNNGAITGTNAAGILVNNYGSVLESTNKNQVNGLQAGGIAVDNNWNIELCANDGNITGSVEGQVSWVGGIAVTNAGTITGISSTESAPNSVDMNNLTGNTGILTGTMVGGIASYAKAGSSITYSTNHGNLYALDSTTDAGDARGAGILCLASGEDTDEDTDDDTYDISLNLDINTGLVYVNNTLDTDYSAGIAYNTSGLGLIEGCRNYGIGYKYGITSQPAKTIKYCFNADDSEIPIGCVSSQTDQTSVEAGNENIHSNYYIGEKEEYQQTYFKAERYMSTHNHVNKNGNNVNNTNHNLYVRNGSVSFVGNKTDVTSKILGDFDYVDGFTYQYGDKVSEYCPYDWWGRKTNNFLTYDISAYDYASQESTGVYMSDIEIVWDNYPNNITRNIYKYWNDESYNTWVDSFKAVDADGNSFLRTAVDVIEGDTTQYWFIINFDVSDMKSEFGFGGEWLTYNEYSVGEFDFENDDTGMALYSKFIFGLYCYMYEELGYTNENITYEDFANLITEYYSYCGTDDVANANNNHTIGYHLVLEGSNGEYLSTNELSITIPADADYYEAQYNINDLISSDKVYNAGFTVESEVSCIRIIVTDSSDDEVGLRTIRYKDNAANEYKGMSSYENAQSNPYANMTIDDVKKYIANNYIAATSLYPEADGSNYRLMLYEKETGIAGLTYNPLDEGYHNDETQYASDNTYVRKTMWTELDYQYMNYVGY